MGISERDYMKENAKKVVVKKPKKEITKSETPVKDVVVKYNVEPSGDVLSNRDVYNLMIKGEAIVLNERPLNWYIRRN